MSEWADKYSTYLNRVREAEQAAVNRPIKIEIPKAPSAAEHAKNARYYESLKFDDRVVAHKNNTMLKDIRNQANKKS